MKPLIADSLWAEWNLRHGAELSVDDIRVDTIRAVGGDVRRYRVRGVEQPLTVADFAASVKAGCVEGRAIVDAHISEWQGELLSHLLVADLRRHVVEDFELRGRTTECGCIECMDLGMRSGDASVQNAIAISLVEDLAWWEPERQPLIDSWPHALQMEVERHREATEP